MCWFIVIFTNFRKVCIGIAIIIIDESIKNTLYSSTIIEYLQTEQKLIAAIYSRVDLGIHYDGWTCEEMHEFMSEYFNVGTVENVRDSYNQLVEIPTNYQEYFFTYLKICDMYDRVKNKKGDNFNVKEFHKYILDCGPAPLRFVEEVVYDAYRIK